MIILTSNCVVAGQSHNITGDFSENSISFNLSEGVYIKFTTPDVANLEYLEVTLNVTNFFSNGIGVYAFCDLMDSPSSTNPIQSDNVVILESTGIPDVYEDPAVYTFSSYKLEANTTYYLHFYLGEDTFVGDEAYGQLGVVSSHIITVKYTCVVVYVDNGSAFETYECYIDNGTSWDLYWPYIDNGTSWSLYGSCPVDPSDSKGFASDSWGMISAVSRTGTPENYYTVGDEKNIILTTGEVITLTIIGFNHDDLSDGTGKAGITIQMKNLLATTYNMNSSDTNSGSWGSSAMRTRLQPNGGIYETLPSDVKSVIRPVNKITSAGGSSTSLVTTSDYAFLLSEIEIFGALKYSVAGQGSRYSYYSINDDNNIKYLSNGSGESAVWWERSPRSGYSSQFCAVAPYSTFDNRYSARNASVSHGISFAFCV